MQGKSIIYQKKLDENKIKGFTEVKHLRYITKLLAVEK